jgi:hypothetical protein
MKIRHALIGALAGANDVCEQESRQYTVGLARRAPVRNSSIWQGIKHRDCGSPMN